MHVCGIVSFEVFFGFRIRQFYHRRDRIALMAELRIGTSAFTAADWPGTFYPEGLPDRTRTRLPKAIGQRPCNSFAPCSYLVE
jgi:hypothetical protein